MIMVDVKKKYINRPDTFTGIYFQHADFIFTTLLTFLVYGANTKGSKKLIAYVITT